MNIRKNWKIVVAAAVIVLAIIWAVGSVRSQTYNGSNLTFAVGRGVVTVTNSTEEGVPVQLAGTGSRSFTVASPSEDIGGTSVREGSGRTTTQLFDFVLPAGTSEFTIARGENVNFTASGDSRLSATVEPGTPDETRASLIVAGVVILGALFFISRATDHQWINIVLRREVPAPVLEPVAVTPAGESNRGQDGRMYSNYGMQDK